MAIDLQNSQNIATGWGPPPKLDAPSIGSTLAAILENKYRQQALMQKNISDAIKTAQEQRQQAAYAEALRNTGLSEGQDLSGLSPEAQTRMVAALAARTPDKQRDALIQAQIAHLNRLPGGRGSGGGGGSTEPETRWDAQGREWRPGPGGRWILITPPRGTGEKPTDISKAVKEQMSVQDQFDLLEKDRKKQEAEDIAAGRANVPFKQSDLYNLERNRLEQLKKIPGMPSTEPQGVPQRPPAETGDTTTPPPADTAAGHGQDYGTSTPDKPTTPGQMIDPDRVKQYITAAGGDRDKARQMARADGWSF